MRPGASLDLQIVDVHELHADGPAVGRPQEVEDLSERHLRARARDGSARKGPVEVRFAELVVLEFELRMGRPRQAEGVEVGEHVAADPIRPDELVDLVLLRRDVRARVGTGVGGPCGRRRRPRRRATLEEARRRTEWTEGAVRRRLERGEVRLPIG
jgi:hypothetical protein